MGASEKNVCILDYGSGNVRSVFNLVSALNPNVVISNQASDLAKATHFILPGVGSFGSAMEKIKARIPLEELKREVFEKKKPFLGICVGMQVLADRGTEFGSHEGLGWISGDVEKIQTTLPLPHIGWNNLETVYPSPLVSGLSTGSDFYFVHSYIFKPRSRENILATCQYGESFTCIIQKENVYGVQFHPEKSQHAGKLLITNFLGL